MPINLDNSITITTYMVIHEAKPWRDYPLKFTTNKLFYLEKGALIMMLDSKPIPVNAGDILFIPGNTTYYPVAADDVTMLTINFKATFEDNSKGIMPVRYAETENSTRYWIIPNHSYITIPQLSHHSNNPEVKTITKKFMLLNIKQKPALQLLANCLLRELLITISEEFSVSKTINPTLHNIIKYIKKNYDQNLSLSHLSEQFGITTSHISRLFRTELSTKTIVYINQTRIAAACDLLVNTNLSISEISEKVGFNHQHYFNRVFQELCKTTPGEFRRSSSDI